MRSTYPCLTWLIGLDNYAAQAGDNKAYPRHAHIKNILFTNPFHYSTTLQHLCIDNICLSVLLFRPRTGWSTMPSIPPSRPKTGHSYDEGHTYIRTRGRMDLFIFQDHMCTGKDGSSTGMCTTPFMDRKEKSLLTKRR